MHVVADIGDPFFARLSALIRTIASRTSGGHPAIDPVTDDIVEALAAKLERSDVALLDTDVLKA
jgi:hypothetical protein